MSQLFSPLRIREIELKNRVAVSPMCQYSAVDGHPQTWHLVHLGSRAVGGAGLVMAEASAVESIGKISPTDAGIYLDSHIAAWRPIVDFIRAQGSVAGIQLAHAGRKASTAAPWLGSKPLTEADGAWTTVAPSAIPFDQGYSTPHALSINEIRATVEAFRKAAERALAAGFEVIEIHSAHGYLLHQFLSPFSNTREDEYGGSFENRIRLLLRVAKSIREVWPARLPLFVRLSATDWKEGGWDLDQSVELSRRLKPLGVDLIDASSGGNVPRVKIPVAPGYQVAFAEAIRKNAVIATGAVGVITDPAQAESILVTGQADLIFLARQLLRDPYWPRRAAKALESPLKPPVQYERAW
ncbi:MAG TPA: NADH:flavin oxidoreductase/NADH oxidase [Candidatus Dormibacteraeota bacterium]|nr:NADH:flavin oxidoreductase/NADH oxidase [Candidatus Dormibacteraeota bacterium]